MNEIPTVDIGPLFSDDPAARAEADERIAAAAFDIGFMVVTGHPADLQVRPAERVVMLKLFALPMAVQRPLWKRNFAPERPHRAAADSRHPAVRAVSLWRPPVGDDDQISGELRMAHLRPPRAPYADPMVG